MTTSPLLNELQEIFRDVFGDDLLVLEETMTAQDVPGWDSLGHLNLIIALEKRFSLRFSTAEIAGLAASGQNIGSLLAVISSKME